MDIRQRLPYRDASEFGFCLICLRNRGECPVFERESEKEISGVRPDESGDTRGRTRRDSLKLTGHQGSIFLILVSAPPALMATFVASSIGSLKGTSIRSRPCS